MMRVTSLPVFILCLLRGMPGVWKGRHPLWRCWLSVMQALFPGRKTLAALARWTPAQITAWRWRRLLTAAYWNVHLLVEWWAAHAVHPLPPPEDGVRTLTGDGSETPQRGTPHPLAQKGRKSAPHPWFFGGRFALLIVRWEGCRRPVAFRLIRPQSPPQSQTEHALFRDMVRGVTPPSWATAVIVEGDAASGATANRPMVRQRDADDPERPWGVLFAIARPWQTVEGTAIKALGTPVPRPQCQRPGGPRISACNGRKTFGVSSTRVWLRHSGDVTVVLRKTGRTVSPQPTNILVTTLPQLTPRYVVFAYQRRWAVEQINRERKSDLGMGEQPVRRDEGRMEKSFGLALIASLFLIRACHHDVSPGHAWSIAPLQHTLRLQMITNQVAHDVKTRLTKSRKAASLLAFKL